MINPKKLMRGALVALALVAAAPLPTASGLIGVGVAQAQEARLVSSVLFEGNSGLSDKELLAMVDVGSRGSFTQGSLAADAENIRLAYVDKGYVDVTVTPRLEAVDGGRTRVTFVIDEGGRTGIAAINFTGNNTYDAGTLKSVIRTRETHLLSWLFRDDAYSQTQLEVDKQLIQLYYMNHGFPDAYVTSAVAEYDSSRNAYFVNFTISEGERYSFGNVGIETSISDLNTNAFNGLVRTDKGERYSIADLEKTQEALAFEATAQGYAFADVRPRVDRDIASRTFNVTYLIDEGARVYVERINITGNEKTRDAVIRRELDFGEGDAFNRSMVQRGKKNIEALGFFKVVNVDLEQGSAPDKVVLNISVVEQSTGDYGLSAGYSSEDGVLGEVSITERNFLGRGQYVRASVGASGSGQSYSLSFTEPRFMGLRISSGFDVYHRIVDETDSNIYGTTTTGGQIRFGLPITTDISSSVYVGAASKTIADADGDESVIYDDGDQFNKIWVGYSLTYNGLDNTNRPTEGLYATFSQEYIGLDYNLLKTEARARYFVPLMSDYGIVGSIKGQAGLITDLGGGDVSPLEAFTMSSKLVRGFQAGGMGPKTQTSGELLGYTGYVGASAEIEFPLPVIPESYGLRGAVWADAAVIDGSGSGLVPAAGSVDDNFKSSVGASVIWDSPFGPLRGDFAYVLNQATDDKTEVFQLTIQNLL